MLKLTLHKSRWIYINILPHIAAVKQKLSNSPIISSVEIVDERVLLNRGYFRVRLTLFNADFLELAESFAIQNNQLMTLDYRYQWMDASKQILKKRWDSVKHFPDLTQFSSSCSR